MGPGAPTVLCVTQPVHSLGDCPPVGELKGDPTSLSCLMPSGGTKNLPQAPAGCPGPRSSCPANAATEPGQQRGCWGPPTPAAHENHVGSIPKPGRTGPVRVNVFPSSLGDPEPTWHLGIGGLDGGQLMPDVTLTSPPDRSRTRTLTPTQPFPRGATPVLAACVPYYSSSLLRAFLPWGVGPGCPTPRAMSGCPPPSAGSALPRMSLSFSRVPCPLHSSGQACLQGSRRAPWGPELVCVNARRALRSKC